MSQSPSLYNIDRWFNYSKQKLHISSYSMHMLTVDWPRLTPNQSKRMIKKMRKNNDLSLNI